MINISLKSHPELYHDWQKALNYLKFKVDLNDYDPPEEKVLFHTYTEIRSVKELQVIKSYLATQDLENSKLIVWSDYDISCNQLIKPYKDLVDFRVYYPKELGKGTPLEDELTYLFSKDKLHYVNSDILRLLLMYKYGGFWIDMDMVLLNNMGVLYDQEFAYMWGKSLDFVRKYKDSDDCFGPCNALMHGFKHSDHTKLCVKEILTQPMQPESFKFGHELLANVYRRKPFTVFPSAFFNTEWQFKRDDNGEDFTNGWFEKPTQDGCMFLEAFAWHWHNSSNKNKKIVENSKFDRLMKRTDKLLKEKGIL